MNAACVLRRSVTTCSWIRARTSTSAGTIPRASASRARRRGEGVAALQEPLVGFQTRDGRLATRRFVGIVRAAGAGPPVVPEHRAVRHGGGARGADRVLRFLVAQNRVQLLKLGFERAPNVRLPSLLQRPKRLWNLVAPATFFYDVIEPAFSAMTLCQNGTRSTHLARFLSQPAGCHHNSHFGPA
jgi:hypothetical protein